MELYNKIIQKYEWIPQILNLVKEFKELFQNKNLKKFDIWLKKAFKLNLKKLNSFINGLVEVSVNKLKTLNRTMYGKASFKTVKRKLL